MKKILFTLSLLCISTVNSVIFAKGFSFGIEGGAGLNTAEIEFNNSMESDFDFIPTYRFGANVEYSFNDVTSIKAKTLFHHSNGFSFTDSTGKTKVSFDTIDIPVLMKLCFAGIENIPGRFSVFAGPNFSFRFSDIRESHGGFSSDEKLYKSDDIFAAGIEAGAEYAFSKESGFLLGFSTLLDFTSFSKDKDFDLHRICVMPYLGYQF